MTGTIIFGVNDFRTLLRSLDKDRSETLTFSLVNTEHQDRVLRHDEIEEFKSNMQSIFFAHDVYQIAWSTFVVKWNGNEDSSLYQDLKARYSPKIQPLVAAKRFDVRGSLITLWNEFECESRKHFSKSEREDGH